MKFVCNININKSINEVVAHFEDPESLKQSQKDFIRMEHLIGNKGETGAKTKLVYKKFDLIETIIQNTLPDAFYAKYEHKSMTNTMRTSFIVLNENKTKLTTEIHYTQFKGLFLKLISKLFPSLFKKQVDKWLERFKIYCEKQ
ncbi:SRPBCC family protein [Algibacter sp.]|uniref:SRPBCC family protein n=1 Tax=Algibacter sp. TaxID=1872428 RepID=UPI003C7916FB